MTYWAEVADEQDGEIDALANQMSRVQRENRKLRQENEEQNMPAF